MKLTRGQLESYSNAAVTRRELQEQLGEPLSFGSLLMQLHEHGLPLPRYPVDTSSPGYQLIKRAAEQGASGG